MAERIAFFGFNAVRLHHMDYYFEPEGIFEDTSASSRLPEMKKTEKLSRRQLDKLDYLIYQLKLHGIYIDMNLLVSRHFTLADGVNDADKLDIAAKPVSMFNPKLIQLQKTYAKDLLTHYNKYTKLRYCDDPAIAIVEITNENSLFNSWKNNQINGPLFKLKKGAIPEYYSKELDQLWNSWLKEKYSTPENVKKAWTSFRNAQEFPREKKQIFELKHWLLEQTNGTECSKESSSDETIFKIKKISAIPWNIQYYHGGIDIKKNKNYLLKFSAKAEEETKISLTCQQNYSPFDNLGLFETIQLNKEYQEFKIPFTCGEDCVNARISFLIGYADIDITLRNISFEEVDGPEIFENKDFSGFSFPRPLYKLKAFYSPQMITDITDFYTCIGKYYLEEMIEFLKNDVEVKIPITGIGGYSQPEDIETQSSCDFLDIHGYWDHPHFPNTPWDRNDFTIHNKSILLDKKLGIINTFLERFPSKKNKPHTISEWNHCYPNQYAYETPILIAAEGVKNNWDGLFQFAFKHGLPSFLTFSEINSYFDIMSNPQQLLITSLGSVVFLKNDSIETAVDQGMLTIKSPLIQGITGFIKNRPLLTEAFTITAEENGAVLLLKREKGYLLITVSETKNSGSGWNPRGKFNWGTYPLLLKRIPVKINSSDKKPLKVYELNNRGERKKEIPVTTSKGRDFFSTTQSQSPWFEISLQ